MANHGYKKYMKKEAQNSSSPLFKVFIISFFGMLLFFTFLIKSLPLKVDTSIGDYKESASIEDDIEQKKIVDNRLEMIQNEDNGKNFSDIMDRAENAKKPLTEKEEVKNDVAEKTELQAPVPVAQDPVYKVFIGSYSSADQARVAKEIIQESGNGLNPIVKCIGTNNYTLQVGIFKNKKSAETMLYTVQQSNLPGRIVQEY